MVKDRAKEPRIHEFKVSIQGLELDDETRSRISGAVQAAALTALAGLDFKGDFAARVVDNGTQGIQLVALSEEQSRQLGFE